MRQWQAIVPIKQGTGSKSRLSGVLDTSGRMALMRQLAGHVVAVLRHCPDVCSIAILSPARPGGWYGDWIKDEGRGLNAELKRWHIGLGGSPAMVIHADLPLVCAADVSILLASARANGSAMATDRAGNGTNALALASGGAFDFRFGAMSRHLHTSQCPDMPVLERVGLVADLDTPDDLSFAESRGFRVEQACHREGLAAAPALHKAAMTFDQESRP